MGKNTNFVSHKKSKQKVNGMPQLPSAASLVEGEIAINFAKDVETLSIKNESGDVVTFSSDNYYSELKLGSAFTGANSAVTVTDYINNLDMGNEVEVNSGDTPSSDTIEIWVDESVEPEDADVYSKSEVDTLLNEKLDEDVFASYSGTVDSELRQRALQGDLEHISGITIAHTANTSIHVTSEDKTAWDAKLDSSDVDQVIDSTTSASTKPVATQAVYDVVDQLEQTIDGGLDDLSDKFDEHSGNTTIHVTSADKTAWNAKVDVSDLAIYADSVKYNSTNHSVEFYNGTTAGTKVFEFDAAPFLIDGMVENVEIDDISGTTYLVISFNTDAGKQDINVPVSEIFNADEYYTKDEIDEADEIVAAALNDLEARKMDASGMTNYYTKSETSGATEISTALGNLSNDISDVRDDLSGHSADTQLHLIGEDRIIFDNLKDNADILSGITNADIANWDDKQNRLVSGLNIKTINNESILGQGNIEYDQVIDSGTSASTNAVSTNAVFNYITDNERVVAAALTDLDERKLDASAYTPSGEELWVSGTGLNSVVLKGSSGTASGDYSVAEGYSYEINGETYASIASGSYSHTEGAGTLASGDWGSHAEGDSTVASGDSSHAEGSETLASGDYSHTEGEATLAEGYASHAEGEGTSATSNSSHAEGYATLASGNYSHAEGINTKAIGNYGAHAEGDSTVASGEYSHAEGSETLASGDYSHAEGDSTIANNISEHASGQYNVSSTASTIFGNSGNTLFSVGNGTADNARHNAFEIRQNGDIYIVSGGSEILLQDNLGGNITIDQVIDSTTSASTDAVSTSAVYGFVTSYTPSITVDQDFSNTASTNPISTKAVYSAITDNELVWTNAYVTISGAISSHTEDTSIHVTAADKEKLHTHSNKSALDSITGNVGTMAYQNASSYSSATEVNTALGNKANTSDLNDFFDDAKYEDSGTTKVINFYHGNTLKATIDASDFIVDGMVDDVRIENGNLVIDFNTASGKQDISIPLTDIFDPSNYYNKTAIDSLVGSGFTSSSITDVIIENEQIVSAALTDIDDRKLDASAYTPTDLSNYYTKSETSGATEITNAFNNKADSAITFTAGTGLSGGGDLSSNRTFSLAMPTTYSAETYTSSTITSSEPVVYALVRYTGTTALANQVCPVTLADGQQCNVIYQSANNNAYDAVISTNYVEPDGQQITLKIPAEGYAEINYINIKGIIFVRGI